MEPSSDHITIHTKKFYRVILDGIDKNVETTDSFAVKLATRLHVSLPRAMIVADRLPYIVKSGVTAAQANRLKAVLEEIGGRARVEAHLITPDDERDPQKIRPRTPLERQTTIVCPACGWEEKGGATYCSFCFRKFRDVRSRLKELEQKLPETNPLEVDSNEYEFHWAMIASFVQRNRLRLLLGVAAILVLILLAK